MDLHTNTEHKPSCPKVDKDKIIVNGRPKPRPEGKISYIDVIILAFGEYIDNPRICYTVEYFRGCNENPTGSMVKGDKVQVTPRMVFSVTKTDKS